MATPRKDWQKEWERVQKQARKLAKRANQRMVRLERKAKQPGYSNILKYAYARAEEYIRNFIKEDARKLGKARFKETVKLDEKLRKNSPTEEEFLRKNISKQKMHIKAMEQFLESQSSTIGESRIGPKTKGIKAIYDKRAATITGKFLSDYGYEMSADDLKRFFDSKKQAKLESIVGSQQMFIVAAVIKKQNIKGSRKELEEYVKTHVKVNDPNELKMKKTESRAQYLERLRDKLNYTNDPILNDVITNALKAGINASNIFI